MTKSPPRICETCADQYLPFQVRNAKTTRLSICDTCNRWRLTESVSPKSHIAFWGTPFVRDYEKISNELEIAYVEACSSQNFDLAEDIALMIDKFEFEKYQSEKDPHD